MPPILNLNKKKKIEFVCHSCGKINKYFYNEIAEKKAILMESEKIRQQLVLECKSCRQDNLVIMDEQLS